MVVMLSFCIRTAAKRLSFIISPNTFEVIGDSMSYSSITFVVVVIYRPVGDAVISQFYTELTAVHVLEQLVNYSSPVIVTNDLNIHLDVVDGRDTRRLAELLRHIRPQPVGVCADSQRRSYSRCRYHWG